MITQVLESSAVWGVLLTLAAFGLGVLINKRTGIDGHYYFDQHLQCSALYGRLRFVGRQEGGVISIRN